MTGIKIDVAEEYELFEVQGAGHVGISKNADSMTGTAVGFSVGASWSKYGIACSGVMGREEARRMALFILKKVDGLPSENIHLREWYWRAGKNNIRYQWYQFNKAMCSLWYNVTRLR